MKDIYTLIFRSPLVLGQIVLMTLFAVCAAIEAST